MKFSVLVFFKFLFVLTIPTVCMSSSKDVKTWCEDVGMNIASKDIDLDTSKLKYTNHLIYYDLFKEYNTPKLSSGSYYFFRSLNSIAREYNSTLRATSKENSLAMLELIKVKIETPSLNVPVFKFKDTSDLNLDYNKRFIPLACYSVLSFIDCQRSLEYLLSIANPKMVEGTANEVIFGNLLNKVLVNKDHQVVIKLLAKSLIKDTINFINNGSTPSDDIYKRILQIATISGFKLAKSEELAFDILGAYSIRGASFFSDEKFLPELSKSDVGVSFLFLASAISFLDKAKYHKRRELFSLPRGYLRTSCLYGKPYHFWMAAYISRTLMKDGGFNKRKSFLATHLSGVGYEVAKKTSDFNMRDSYFKNIIESESLDDIDVKNAKIDIVFNSFGSGFGVSYMDKVVLDGDAILQENFQSGYLSWVRVFDYQTWMEIVAPHSHINMIVKP